MIQQEISIPIYGAKLIVIFTDNLAGAMKEYSDEEVSNDIALTVHFPTPLKYVVGFDTALVSHMAISHETCHITHRIMLDVGIPPTFLSDEPEAYLHGYIINEIYKIVKENKLMCYESIQS